MALKIKKGPNSIQLEPRFFEKGCKSSGKTRIVCTSSIPCRYRSIREQYTRARECRTGAGIDRPPDPANEEG
jgi:hypothetical protein